MMSFSAMETYQVAVPIKIMKNLIVVLFFAIFTGCNYLLPLPSKGGKNIFGCKVEGKVIKPSGQGLFSKSLVARMTNSYFSVSATDFNDDYRINIIVNGISKKGKYIIDGKINKANVYIISIPKMTYQATYRQKNEVYVSKFDTLRRIVSGTFEFKVENIKDSTDIIKVTKGRFDLKIE